jgi:CRP-like cAMP-binding protein
VLAEPEFASVEARVRLLRSMPDLGGVAVDTLILMAEDARFRRFRRGAAIWREANPITSVLYVLEGRVRIERDGTTLGKVESRHALGFTALLTEGVQLTATAEVMTVALEIPGDAVRLALQRDFGLQRLVLRGIARALRAERGPLPEADAPDEGTWREAPCTVVERVIELRRSPFARTNVDGLAEIASAATEVRFEKGDVLWTEGDPSTHWLRLLAGIVRCETADGADSRVGAGMEIGTLDALAETPRTHTARAACPVIALRIELIDWLTVLELHTRLAVELTAFLAGKLKNY